jgi:hypothetical protein
MDGSEGGAEVLVQLISPEDVPVCECVHHEDHTKLTSPRSGKQRSAKHSQRVLLFLHAWHPPYFIFFVSILEVSSVTKHLL